jgi:hypothetical protein
MYITNELMDRNSPSEKLFSVIYDLLLMNIPMDL